MAFLIYRLNTMPYLLTMIFLFACAFFPSLSYAAINSLQDLVIASGSLVGLLIPVAFSLAVLFFFWGLGKFIFYAGSDVQRAEGKQIMIWGVVALFVMASIWGIINFFQGEILSDIDTEIRPFQP